MKKSAIFKLFVFALIIAAAIILLIASRNQEFRTTFPGYEFLRKNFHGVYVVLVYPTSREGGFVISSLILIAAIVVVDFILLSVPKEKKNAKKNSATNKANFDGKVNMIVFEEGEAK